MEPEDIERKEFLVSLRGYDRDEVDSFLQRVADELRRVKGEIRPVEDSPPAGDKEAMYKQVGEETSRILLAAEEAGKQIRDRAQREAAEMLVAARAKAEEIARQSQAERQTAEEDLRKLREARGMLATQLDDVRRRLDEAISRLTAPIEDAGARKPRAKKAAGPGAEAAPAAQIGRAHV